MIDYQGSVALFHKTFKLTRPSSPTLSPLPTIYENADLHKLRVKLIREEVDELEEALDDDDIVEVADAIGDILYLAFGSAVSYGIDIEPIFAEIQRSNMSKLPEDGIPLIREDGKVMKPSTYSPPDILPILNRQIR